MILMVIAPFVAAVSFAVLYRVPQGQLIYAGLIGSLGHVTVVTTDAWFHPVVGVFLGAAVVALVSELLARKVKQPVTIFLIPGIIPLVPGGQAYVTMLKFLNQDYVGGVEEFITTLFLAGAIAGGIIVISSVFRFRGQRRLVVG